MKYIKHSNLFINIGDKGHFFLSCEKSNIPNFEYGYINSSLMLDADYEAEYKDINIMPTNDFITYRDMNLSDNDLNLYYDILDKNVSITENIQLVKGLNLLKQKTIIKNTGTENRHVARLAVCNVLGVGIDGSRYFENNNRFIVHYCINRMQSEGQWQQKTLKDLGLYPASTRKWERSMFRLDSFSSWSTNNFYPLVIIEDTEKNECWFFEREGAESWFIEILVNEGFSCPFLTVSLGGADEKLSWSCDLMPNQSYCSTTAVYGLVKGNFENAIKELYKYKRLSYYTLPKVEVCFNDFMNCNWAIEDTSKLYPLIDATANLGVECFVIDAGWSKDGVWRPDKNIFPNDEFQKLINYIINKGMRAGIWLELEYGGHEYEDKFLRKRNGLIISKHRPKLDMRCSEVIDRLWSTIDYLYACGIRYIKNDHNNDERCGTNYTGESFSEGTRQNTLAFYSFIKSVKDKYPDLIIENCAAGGAREDNGTLKYFDIQSTSDQEDYKLYPSILIGSLACITPEKAGIWGYPYPLTNKYSNLFTIPKSILSDFSDGNQTVFNMVSTMAGHMYLSGKLDVADKFNTHLIKSAIDIYKNYKDSLYNRYVSFQSPIKNIDDKSFRSIGLYDNDNMLLFVWALQQTDFSIDLSRYKYSKIEKIYPCDFDNIKFNMVNNMLNLDFSNTYTACIFLLK